MPERHAITRVLAYDQWTVRVICGRQSHIVKTEWNPAAGDELVITEDGKLHIKKQCNPKEWRGPIPEREFSVSDFRRKYQGFKKGWKKEAGFAP